MTEETTTGLPAADPASGPPEQAPTSFGARLRWERERAGLTVTDVAARLRLHLNQVRALEQEALGELPEAAYVRGFIRSYARILNIDPAPLLDDLAGKLAPNAASVVDGMAQQRDYSPVRAAARERTSRRFVVLGAVLLLIVLGVLGWWATRTPGPTVTSGSIVPAPVTAAPPPATQPVPVAEPAAPVVIAQAASPAPDSGAVLEAVAPPPLLKLRFNDASWAEIKDAEGKVLHSQHNVTGSEFVIEGTPPFYVVIGDAGKANVEVRGEPYDLAPYTRQNVARFTVN